MIYFFLITALTVSIDSFACAFALSINVKHQNKIVLIIALTVFLMCLTTNYFGKVFSSVLNEKTASLGGLILIGVGLYNLFKTNKASLLKKSHEIKQAFLTGIAVGLDGSLGNLSLAIMGLNAIYVPITIAVMHALLVNLGINLSQMNSIKKLEKIVNFSPLILTLLGVYKLYNFFF